MYKLIALDMDGTLLREDKTVSERTKKAIDQAREQGVTVVLASGRPLEGLRRYLTELEMLTERDYVVCYNGALVQNTATKEIVNDITLTGKELKELYALSKELGLNIHAFSKEGCITPEMTEYSELEGRINGIDVHVKNYDEIDDDEVIIKIMMVEKAEILEEAIKAIPQSVCDQYTIVRSAPFFLEFLNPNVDKGVGVKALADKLGIKREEVICMGDAGNDAHMVKYAGLGVAMGNAFEELKEVADYITSTNEEDGVAEVIEKFVLNQ